MLNCMLVVLLIFLCATYSVAQETEPGKDARQLLLEVRSHVMETVNRLPRYLCTETVDRTVFRPEFELATHSCDDLASRRKRLDWKLQKHTTDRLRLDVAISADSEMYAWAGEDRFEDRSLAELVRGGATSTGVFASFLASIFGNNGATFTYNGDVKSGETVRAEFGFRVPLENSSYRVRNDKQESLVGYNGIFLVDPITSDLVRLTIHSDQLPATLHACETTTSFDYERLRLNSDSFLIPKGVQWRVITFDGTELDSHMLFSACHEFQAESSVRFDETLENEALKASRGAIKSLDLSPGIFFSIALTEPIYTATAAAGDLLNARLTSAIKDKSNGILIPKGAAVKGRIFRIERLYGRSESLTLAIRLEAVDVNGVPRPFHAAVESVVKRRQKMIDGPSVRQDLGSFDRMFDPDDNSVGFLQFEDVTKDFVIASGIEVEGRTTGLR